MCVRIIDHEKMIPCSLSPSLSVFLGQAAEINNRRASIHAPPFICIIFRSTSEFKLQLNSRLSAHTHTHGLNRKYEPNPKFRYQMHTAQAHTYDLCKRNATWLHVNVNVYGGIMSQHDKRTIKAVAAASILSKLNSKNVHPESVPFDYGVIFIVRA